MVQAWRAWLVCKELYTKVVNSGGQPIHSAENSKENGFHRRPSRVAQLLEYLRSMHRALGSVPSST